MRIEVNLLPGAKRGRRKASGGAAVDFAKLGQAIAAKFKDFYLALAVASGAAAVAVILLVGMPWFLGRLVAYTLFLMSDLHRYIG